MTFFRNFEPEFIQAWQSLGLKGTDDEIKRSFTDVDTDNSGKVERLEFMKAIKGSRMAELSLSVLMTQMDGQLEGLEDIFNDFKRKKEEAEKQALADLDMSKAAYARFQGKNTFFAGKCFEINIQVSIVFSFINFITFTWATIVI